MHETVIDWRGVAAGLTLGDLLDDSYLHAPAEAAPHAPPDFRLRPEAASGEANRLARVRPALRHLLD